MEESIKKIPPHSLESEQSVVGSIFIDNDSLLKVITIIDPEDFYQPDLKLIYEIMINLHREDSPIDLVTVGEKLKSSGLDQVINISYVSKLALRVPTSVNIGSYAKIIREKSYLRKIIKYSHDLISEAYNQSLEGVLSKINPPALVINKNKHKRTSELIQLNLDEVSRRYNAEDDSRGMTTGFIDLDRLTDGIKGAEIVGLYAESNAGKSIVSSDIARHIAKKYGPVTMFAYEMLSEDITYRMLSDEMRLHVDKLNRPKANLTEFDFETIKRYTADHLDNIHIFADELVLKTACEIESRIAVIQDLKLIVIDYLHLMDTPRKYNNDIDRYTYVLRDLKSLATKYRVPILLLMSQTKEGGFRGTEELKHDLDQLWELVRKGEDAQKSERESAIIYVKKGRNNRKGKVNLWYQEDFLTFKSRESK